MAGRIVELFPEHTSYVEPYVGSAAVLLAKEPVAVELVNDFDELLIAFYRTLRTETTRYRLIDALTYTPYARAEVEAAEDDPSLDDVERARRFMVRTNQGFGGGQGNWTATLRGSSGHSNATKWNNFRTRLSLLAERLQNVQIDCKDAVEVLSKIWTAHDPAVAVYLDPPYLETTRNGSRYSQEASLQHHEDMLDLAIRLAGPVVLSGYDSALYAEALGDQGAGWKKYSHNVVASSSSGKGSTANRIEVLWANRLCRLPTDAADVLPVDETDVVVTDLLPYPPVPVDPWLQPPTHDEAPA
jgi:DNA adenine methylase